MAVTAKRALAAVCIRTHIRQATTMRNDRAHTSLDRHATYIVATYIAGAAR